MKEELLRTLGEIESNLKSLRGLISMNNGDFISKREPRNIAVSTAKKWFEEAEENLLQFGIQEETTKNYHTSFEKLIGLGTATNSRASSYKKYTEQILGDWKKEILVPVMKSSIGIKKISSLKSILSCATLEEAEYLDEAIKCAGYGFYRASIVLAWCATINRIHRVTEKLGFSEFSKKTSEMNAIKEGRYKRFSKSFTVNSMNEMRSQVFDNDLLWVLEYWNLIDPNQHDRLAFCFTLRNNCAHPGDAPVTEENLVSFYSDIENIVFRNKSFSLQSSLVSPNSTV